MYDLRKVKICNGKSMETRRVEIKKQKKNNIFFNPEETNV
jgi:hypothetical protein